MSFPSYVRCLLDENKYMGRQH